MNKRKILLSVSFFGLMLMSSAKADPMPATIAQPLLDAEHLLSAHKYAAALTDVSHAQAVPNKTPGEVLAINQLRAAIDVASGNHAAAETDYEALLANGGLSSDQTLLMAKSLASAAYQAADYRKAADTIKTYLATDAQFHPLLLQSYYQLRDCKSLSSAISPAILAVAHGQRPPAENELQMLAYCDNNTNDNAGYIRDMQFLVRFYPSPTYWGDLISQLQVQPIYTDRLGLDFFRLKLAVGIAVSEADYMEFIQEALQAGLPNTAEKIFAHGVSAGILGAGADLDRQNRLHALVDKRRNAANASSAQQIQTALAAKDFQTVFQIGFNEVDGGNAALGIPLMEQSIRSGALRQIDQAELEMGMAYSISGEPNKAIPMWRAVGGNDGAQELATLWTYVH